jgi:pimeloyl-ACP methyl ester carboxylesterase
MNDASADTPASHFVYVNGLRLHHLDWGNVGGTPVVLLHGIRLHAHCWNDFSRRFRDQFHILALDARGHGDSEWSDEQDYHLHSYYEDLRGVMDARELPPAIVIGHSLGARTAMLYAYLHPERVRQLVLVDMGAGLPQTVDSADFSRVTQTPPPQDFSSQDEASDYLAEILSRAPREMIEESVRHGMRPMPSGRYGWKYDPALGGRPQPRPREREWDLWEAIKAIACPTLLVHGAESKVVSSEIAGRMAEEMGDCRLERIERAGHALFTEQPTAFAESVARFLNATLSN